MIMVRSFFINLLGGSEFMWDVCLGVLLALIISELFKLAIVFWLGP